MRGIMGTRGIRVRMQRIRVRMWRIRVGMQGIRVGMRGIRVTLCENVRVYCFG